MREPEDLEQAEEMPSAEEPGTFPATPGPVPPPPFRRRSRLRGQQETVRDSIPAKPWRA